MKTRETSRGRLYVLMARDVPRALVLRRGPSRWYHLIAWNTRDDSFEPGAWFKGRLYEERCDLSPDGELFLYFALKGNWTSSYKGSWTAVSRAPWLHALALWPQGDTWGGGGRFLGPRKIGLGLGEVPAAHEDHPAQGLEVTTLREDAGRTPDAREYDFGEHDWAGRDQAGLEVRSRGGKIYRVVDGVELELADFTKLTPDPKPAPAWAREPLAPLRGRVSRRKAARRRGHGRSG